jgi:putative transcriptional regulator
MLRHSVNLTHLGQDIFGAVPAIGSTAIGAGELATNGDVRSWPVSDSPSLAASSNFRLPFARRFRGAHGGSASRWKEMSRKKSKILTAVRETAKELHGEGVMDQVTLREFDRLGVPPVKPLRPEDICKIRETSQVSQAVFAALLNTSVLTVQTWEMGQKRPTGMALKLLHRVQKRGLEIVAS